MLVCAISVPNKPNTHNIVDNNIFLMAFNLIGFKIRLVARFLLLIQFIIDDLQLTKFFYGNWDLGFEDLGI